MNITPNNSIASHRTGALVGLCDWDITAKLGFSPNIEDDPDKVVNSWGFDVDGKPCAIWDYKGSHKRGIFSTFGPRDVLRRLFGDHYVSDR
ncbi:hypothetical protein [Bradyrhizobium erythrophlei]|uniref:Uncharacterized protein n=1 Tax=Bradyrhizobium erythrophlei TaxID=1437360 RepID=A0A1M5T8Z6_9BRAD|nr:hypothetical protein [Bradyrhizobium erythrophlei]SHH47245.1 hypothetical protein SAMN05444169_7624 [Bradyrhizobium erythrophlei]